MNKPRKVHTVKVKVPVIGAESTLFVGRKCNSIEVVDMLETEVGDLHLVDFDGIVFGRIPSGNIAMLTYATDALMLKEWHANGWRKHETKNVMTNDAGDECPMKTAMEMWPKVWRQTSAKKAK